MSADRTYWAIVTEWEDGTVATTLVVNYDGTPRVDPSEGDLDRAAWLVAAELARDGDFVEKERIHKADNAHYRVGDPGDDHHEVYAQAMGRVKLAHQH